MRVLVFAGHSGGHLFPALAFAEKFKEDSSQIRIDLVSSPKARPITSKMPTGIFERMHFLPEFPSPAGISLRTLRFLFAFSNAFLQTFLLIKDFKPDLCVGFGSYVSYPGIVLASWMKIPTLIHEQNVIPGKATRMLVPFADRVAVSFEDTFKEQDLKRREVTGLPLRSALSSLRKQGSSVQITKQQENKLWIPAFAGMTKERFTLLVVGGSQGSHHLNEIILQTFSRLNPEELKNYAVIHITGEKDFDTVTQTYQKLGVVHETFRFSEKMHELYQRADLAVTRAGANTVFELAQFGLPAILVPYPFAESHQAANAEYFAVRHAVLSRKENSLTPEWLIEKIRELHHNTELRQSMARHMRELSCQDAAERLVRIAKEDLWPSSNKTSSQIPVTHT